VTLRKVFIIAAACAACAVCIVLAPAWPARGLTLTDPAGDDHGPGTYLYPLDAVFTMGSFDVIEFSATEAGSDVRFEIEIAGQIEDPWGSGGGFSLQSIDIYIDTDGIAGSGSTASLERRNVEFSASSAWEYAVWCAPPFDGFDTHVVDAGGNEYYSGITVDVDQGQDVITIDVPKSIIGTPNSSWRYVVLMLGQNGYEPGRIRPVMEDVGQWVLGGGHDGQWDSNVIDVVAEAGVDQEALLANYDPGTGVQAVLINRVDAQGPSITHTPPSTLEAHVPLPVAAGIEDDVVVGASTFFRAPGGAYTEIAMQRTGPGAWECTIPGSGITESGLEYYIYATDATNTAALPDSSSPFAVTVTADVTPPAVTSLDAYPSPFSPNGDGYKDSATVTVELAEPGYVTLEIRDLAGTPVKVLAESVFAETGLAIGWDGRDTLGDTVENGDYRVLAGCTDLAGHQGPPESTLVEVDTDQAARRLDVILLFHANQNLVPYGRAANRACYKGVLTTLRAHPALKFVIHFSGSLLSDLLWSDPETIEILRQGAADGQFEITGSTYIQNIIYSTRSTTDDFQFNHHQIAIHRDLIESCLGVSPVSFWNPERVWTQNIVKLLTDNGYEHVQIEDHILYDSGITGSEYAVRTTTYLGQSVNVFDDDKTFEGIINGAIDSGDTASVMAFLRDLYDDDTGDMYAVCYHEDMEATGLWDYEGGENPAVDFANLDKLLTALESDPRIKVTTYDDFLKEHETYEDVSPIVDGAAVWMGEDAWFDENAEPQAEAYRQFFDSIRDTLNAVHAGFGAFAPDTAAARGLIDHAWFTLAAHQYEFAVHGYGGISGTTQWELARTALVSARAARETLLGQPRRGLEDINGDGIAEIVFVTATDLCVFSTYGGRLLYWFDLEAGVELVGNENFMRTYGEPYTNDNAYVPIVEGCDAYSWLCGNNIIPEINQWSYEARRRCFNDYVWVDGSPAGSLVDMVLGYSLDSTHIDFTYVLGDLTLTKRISPTAHSLGLEYTFASGSSSSMPVEFEIENGLSPDCMLVMQTGRGALKYWDGVDTASVFTGSMPGVTNVVSGRGLLFEFDDEPALVSSEEDIFGLEINPRWTFEIPPLGSEVITFDLSLGSTSGVDPPGGDLRGNLRIFPNPSQGSVDFRFRIDTPSPVSAKVFDLAGRLVRELEGVNAGSTVTLSWDGTNRAGVPVAGGIYFIRVSGGNSNLVGKVAIVR
jgi:flagellar hook assembly protein FlgD